MDGSRVETSPIVKGDIENGKVVTTESGSRYFLSAESVKDLRASAKTTPMKDIVTSKPRPTLRLTQLAKERDAKVALEATEQAKPRSTFSLTALFGLDKKDDETPANSAEVKQSLAPAKSVQRKASSAKAPRGVPTMDSWRQNRDKSITGIISGSASFPDGEKITTSPIAKGTIDSGEVVFTKSGSKYFLQ